MERMKAKIHPLPPAGKIRPWMVERHSAHDCKLNDKTVNGGVNSVGSIEVSHRWELSCTLTTASVVKMHSGKAAAAQSRRADSCSTHISTSGYMFYIIFGATARLHIAQVQLLIKNLYLES